MDKLKALNAIQQRKAAAILGALVADAACKWLFTTQPVSR